MKSDKVIILAAFLKLFHDCLCCVQEWEFSSYATYAYDAVFVFALGLHQLLTEDPSALESIRTDKTVQ